MHGLGLCRYDASLSQYFWRELKSRGVGRSDSAMHPTLVTVRISSSMRKNIQIILVVFFVLAGIRLLLIYRGRHASVPEPSTARSSSNLNADDYVVPTQVHSTDLKSAKE